MYIPLTFFDLSILLAAMAIILLITSELLSASQEFSSRILINRTGIRIAAIIFGLAFLVTVIFGVLQP
jgi:hypothetical protein